MLTIFLKEKVIFLEIAVHFLTQFSFSSTDIFLLTQNSAIMF